MMMINCFCGMVDWRMAFSLISSQDHCQRYSPSRISNMQRAGSEPPQKLSSGLVEWSCAVVITTAPQRHVNLVIRILSKKTFFIKQESRTGWLVPYYHFNYLNKFLTNPPIFFYFKYFQEIWVRDNMFWPVLSFQ